MAASYRALPYIKAGTGISLSVPGQQSQEVGADRALEIGLTAFSDLPELTGANLATDDLLSLFDASSTTLSRITSAQLIAGLCRLASIPYTLPGGVSGTKLSNTGNTTKNTLASITLPANSMGPNGYVLIHHTWTCTTLNTNTKTAEITFGGTTVFSVNMTSASHVTNQAITLIQNRNGAGNQISTIGGSSGNGVIAAGSVVTASVDTTQDVTISFKAQCVTSGSDNLDLERYIIQVCYAP